MQITKLTPQVKDAYRVNLFVDGKFYKGLDRLVVMKLGLKPGLTLTPALLDQLGKLHSSNSAWEYALRSLARSPKSSRQMQKKLESKFEEPLVEITMKRLVESGLIDDNKLGRNLVLKHCEEQTKSRRQIQQWLMLKGFEGELVKTLMQDVDTSYDKAVAIRLVRKRAPKFLKEKNSPKERERLMSYLARRGFSYPVIKESLADLEHIS